VNNGQQVPVANALVYLTMDSNGGFLYANSTTNAQGQVTLDLQEGHAAYQYHASGVVGGTTYVINASAPTVAAIPAVWVIQ